MSTEAGTTARWHIGRVVDALDATRRGPQQPVAHLERLRHARDTLDEATNLMVAAARAEGATWAEIGRALGITRQAARQANQRREVLAAERQEAKQWRMPLPFRRPRLRWLPRRRAA